MKHLVFLLTMLPLLSIAQIKQEYIQPRQFPEFIVRNTTVVIACNNYVRCATVPDAATAALRRDEAIKPLLPRVPGMVCFNRSDLNTMPLTSARDVVALAPAMYQRQRGANTYMTGGPNDAILYVIDGMQIARN